MKSRYPLFETQQAHYYDLNPAMALASMTSDLPCAVGSGHSVRTIVQGYDAVDLLSTLEDILIDRLHLDNVV